MRPNPTANSAPGVGGETMTSRGGSGDSSVARCASVGLLMSAVGVSDNLDIVVGSMRHLRRVCWFVEQTEPKVADTDLIAHTQSHVGGDPLAVDANAVVGVEVLDAVGTVDFAQSSMLPRDITLVEADRIALVTPYRDDVMRERNNRLPVLIILDDKFEHPPLARANQPRKRTQPRVFLAKAWYRATPRCQ